MHQRNLIAQDPDGDFVNVKVGFDGRLSTDPQKTALGGVLSTRLTPVIREAFQHTVNKRVWNTEIDDTGEIKHDNAKVVLSAGNTAGSYAEIISKKRIRCLPGMGAVVRFTAFWEEGDGDQYSSLIGVGDRDSKDGFYFVMSDDGFTIENDKDGIVISIKISQEDWDDPCDGTSIMPIMHWGMGNTFEIRYQYLGYGPIKFYIENPKSGDFQLIHTIKYANANEEPSLSNPTLPFRVIIHNNGVVDAKVKTTYVACFVEGENKIMGIPNVRTFSDTATAVQDNAFTIKNNELFNGKTNHSMVYPQYINISNTDAKTAVVSLISNTALGGVPSYADVDGKTSIVSVDTAGTTIAGGTVFATILVATASAERAKES